MLKSKVTKYPPVLILAVVGTLAAAIVLLISSRAQLGHDIPVVGWVMPELCRDLGIAFVVSCVVAVLFELYRGIHHQLESMRDVIDLVMGEQITPEIWLELKDLIAQKQLLRRNADIRISLSRPADMADHEAILAVEYQYELHALTKKRSKVSVIHELDYQLARPERNLPRFKQAIVDSPGDNDHTVQHKTLENASKTGRIELDLWVGPRGSTPAMVRTERLEVVNTPGAYNLYIPEFTKGLRLHIGDCIDGITTVQVSRSADSTVLKTRH